MLVWCSLAAAFASALNRAANRSPSLAGALSVHHFQRRPGSERLADRLVDDPHAALADVAEDLIVAEPLRHAAPGATVDPRGYRSHRRAAPQLEPLDVHQGGEEVVDILGEFGVGLGIFLRAGRSPLRKRSRNDSARRSIGSRNEPLRGRPAHGSNSEFGPGLGRRASFSRQMART